jgi:hypothetical protein
VLNCQALHVQFQKVEAGLMKGEFSDVELVEDRLKFKRTKLGVPPDMKRTTHAVYDLLPRIRITDLLLEVDATIGFSQQFIHLQSGDSINDPVLLSTVVLAGVVNLGLKRWQLPAAIPPMTDWYR